MNCFEVLGIEKTDEIKKIKRAYAAKTKEFHPEEHPEEFQTLHDAYEEALAIARQIKVQTEQSEPFLEEREEEEEAEEVCAFERTPSEWDETFEQIANASDKGNLNWCVWHIIEECRNLYLNEAERGKLYHWKDLLEEPQYAEVLRTKEFIVAWYEFLESHQMLPFQIWMYFATQDGVLFSAEEYGIQRFSYQVYMEQKQDAGQYYSSTHAGSRKNYGAVPVSKMSGKKKKMSPAVKGLIYLTALAGTAIGSCILGIIAGVIWG